MGKHRWQVPHEVAEFVKMMMPGRLIAAGDMLGVMQRCIMVQQRACEGGAYGYNSLSLTEPESNALCSYHSTRNY
jgi:hypothetical protein